MRVLLVEDSLRLQRSLGTALRKSGHAVDIAGDGEQGLWLAETNSYAAVVLDIMLPKLDGLSVLRQLRAKGRDTHILLLTARDTVDDRVRGLAGGADDYLVKPFALEELLARVDALCRRSHGGKSTSLFVGGLEINTSAKTVKRGDRVVDLLPREYRLLEYLAARLGQVVTRTEIETHIYDDLTTPMSNVVDSAICALRKKIGSELIRTRRGLGYVFG
jgi:DNA-binding response OmpR family regulator